MDSDDGYLDEYCYYNEDEDDDEEEEELRVWSSAPGNYCGFRPSFLFPQNYSLPEAKYITQEEADKNAKELLEEEKREKEKADKKRLKKKRQKDRRRQQKLNDKSSLEEKTVTVAPGDGAVRKVEDETPQESSASGSDDDLDLRSTFVLQAQKKVENKPKPERRERGKERATEHSKERQETECTQLPATPQPQEKVNILDRFKIQESLDLANIGNNMASRERFSEALHYYTEAVKLNPSEYRFLGNRSYVSERLGRYREALEDSETALRLQPNFLKGHFRKGKALKGLKRFSEAIAAFQQVLLFDMNHVEAAGEIIQCQQKMQETMTSSRVKIFSTAPLSPPVTPPTSVPEQNNKVFLPRNIYSTKCDANKPSGGPASSLAVHSRLYPIWVGNITNKITEATLRSKFEPFGFIHSVRVLYARTCAFINFLSKESAEAAFISLQGLNVEGTTFILQLRNPEHNTSGAPGARKIGK